MLNSGFPLKRKRCYLRIDREERYMPSDKAAAFFGVAGSRRVKLDLGARVSPARMALLGI